MLTFEMIIVFLGLIGMVTALVLTQKNFLRQMSFQKYKSPAKE